MLSIILYTFTFASSISLASYGFKIYKQNKVQANILFVLACLFPIFLYVFRAPSVGTDTENYIFIYDEVKKQSIIKFIVDPQNTHHVEFGFYLVNRISSLIIDDYRFAFGICIIHIFVFLFLALKKYSKNKNIWFGLFVFYMGMYGYSFNGVRFAMAGTIIMYAITVLAEKRYWQYIVWIFYAGLFHRSSYIYLSLILLITFKNTKINFLRNIIYYSGVVLCPIILRGILVVLSHFSIFEKYFTSYQIDINAGGLGFLQFILPLIPLIFIYKSYFNKIPCGDLYFNITLLLVPFRYLGYFNEWASRPAKTIELLLGITIPVLAGQITSKRDRILFLGYYFIIFLSKFIVDYLIKGYSEIFPYIFNF